MHALLRLLSVLVMVLMSGCIYSEEPVIDISDAIEVPGIAGYWEPLDNKQDKLLVRHNADNSMSLGDGTGDMSITLRAIRVHPSYYLFEVVNPSAPSILVIGAITPDYFAFYRIDPETFRDAAQKRGLVLTTGANGHIIQRGQSAERVVNTMNDVVSSTDFVKNYELFRRKGSFTEAGGESNTLEAVKRLEKKKDAKGMIAVARYLSDRGNHIAQLMLLRFALQGRLSVEEGVKHGQRAAAQDHSVAPHLLSLYVKFLEKVPIKKTVAEEAFRWTYFATEVDPKYKEPGDKLMKIFAFNYCRNTTTSDVLDCTDTFNLIWRSHALINDTYTSVRSFEFRRAEEGTPPR